MAVGVERARELALSLASVSEAPHWYRQAFRTPRKMFATLGAETRDLNLMFNPDLRDFYCELVPDAFRPVPGGWGRQGATNCKLEAVDEAILTSALEAAHRLAAPDPRKAKSPSVSRPRQCLKV